VHLQKIAPTWLLIDQDWTATKQAIPLSQVLHRHPCNRALRMDSRNQLSHL